MSQVWFRLGNIVVMTNKVMGQGTVKVTHGSLTITVLFFGHLGEAETSYKHNRDILSLYKGNMVNV